MSKRTVILICLAIAAVLGGLREFLFVNLNYQLDHVARSTERSYAHSAFQAWVRGWGSAELTTLKWALAAAFVAVMCALCLWSARVLFAPLRLDRWIVIGYAAVGLVAVLLHGLARFWSAPLEVASVKLLHALQYPVVLVFLWAASALVPGPSTPPDR